MPPFQRRYLREPDFLYQLRTDPMHGFVVGPYEGGAHLRQALGGVIGNRFVILPFDRAGDLQEEEIGSWPLSTPMPEDARIFHDRAWGYLADVAEEHDMGVYAGESIDIKRFFLRDVPALRDVEVPLNWPPGPVKDGRCAYLPIGIEDIPWWCYAHPEAMDEQELHQYWERGGQDQYVLWWQRAYQIEWRTGQVVGT